MEREELKAMEFTYNLFYLDYYCDSFKSLTAAINRAKTSIKHNPHCKGGYNIKLDNQIIAVY